MSFDGVNISAVRVFGYPEWLHNKYKDWTRAEYLLIASWQSLHFRGCLWKSIAGGLL
jgi:hypothetical protein